MSNKPRIVLLGNMDKPGVPEQIRELRPWFEQRAEIVAVGPARGPADDGADEADLCVVFGGDGTLLSAARVMADFDVPMLGVNMGKLGFLAEYNVEHLQKHFDDIVAGRIAPTERMMLAVEVAGCEEHAFSSPAANDVAIAAGAPFRMVDLLVRRNDTVIAQYLGDGLVVATPTGSTGYNMSAGGPILEPTLDAVAITPIAPHSLSVRPIVVGADVAIRITARRVNAGTAAIVDGQLSGGLCDGDTVVVRRAAGALKIIPHPGRTFFRTLTDKLQWGQSPHHPVDHGDG